MGAHAKNILKLQKYVLDKNTSKHSLHLQMLTRK
jgi:hypothetical protein